MLNKVNSIEEFLSIIQMENEIRIYNNEEPIQKSLAIKFREESR